MNKRYAAALGVAAAVVLIAGSIVRPRPHLPKAVPTAAPAQARGTEMRQMSDFLSARANAAANHLAWVASAEATGIQWSDGQVVTVAKPPALVRTVSVASPTQLQPVTLAPLARFNQGGWIVLVARTADGGTVTASGILGGVAPARCGGDEVRRMLFNIPLDPAYSGAGVFGMSGALLGIVIPCNSDWIAVTHDSVQRLLEHKLGPEAIAWVEFGVRTREPSALERKLLRLHDSGVFVAEVRQASTAANMGLRPGDMLLVERAEELLSPREELEVVRSGRVMKLPVTPPYSLEAQASTATLTSIQPNTELAEAGLQPGDRLLNPEALKRRRPVWLLYQREDRYAGVLLP
jgi:hypothetical protein